MTTVNQITPVTISSLDSATTLTGNEAVPIVQDGATVQCPVNQFPQGITAGVVTYGVTGGSPFPNYRTLKAGSNITFTDAGAQADLTVSTTGATGSFTSGGHTLTIVKGIITNIT